MSNKSEHIQFYQEPYPSQPLFKTLTNNSEAIKPPQKAEIQKNIKTETRIAEVTAFSFILFSILIQYATFYLLIEALPLTTNYAFSLVTFSSYGVLSSFIALMFYFRVIHIQHKNTTWWLGFTCFILNIGMTLTLLYEYLSLK